MAAIPDEILAEIFIRLPTPRDVIRVSHICVSFRRVVADRSFLSRFRKLHAPPLLGFLTKTSSDKPLSFQPTIMPYPSSTTNAIALAADFSFSFLPARRNWVLCDIRDGRVLLESTHDERSLFAEETVVCDPLHRRYLHLPPIPSHLVANLVKDPAWIKHKRLYETFSFLPARRDDWVLCDIRDGRVLLESKTTHDDRSFFAEETVVCDPLHRRYIHLPPIPSHLFANLVLYPAWVKHKRLYETFFLPPCDEEETSFRVIWMTICNTKLVTFVFFSSNGQWQAGPSYPYLVCRTTCLFSRHHYVNGCFYWLIEWKAKLLVLDTARMEFFTADAPPGTRGFCSGDISIVEEAGEADTSGMFVRTGDQTSYHKYTVRRNSDGSFRQWDMVKTMSLDSTYFFIGSMGRYALLYRYGTLKPIDAGCFSLDTKTLRLERVCASMPGFSSTDIHIYRNFPPSLLSTPTISTGTQEGAKQAMLDAGTRGVAAS